MPGGPDFEKARLSFEHHSPPSPFLPTCFLTLLIINHSFLHRTGAPQRNRYQVRNCGTESGRDNIGHKPTVVGALGQPAFRDNVRRDPGESSGQLATAQLPKSAARPPLPPAPHRVLVEDGIKYSTTATANATTANWWQLLQIRSEATVRILGRGLNEGLRHLQSGVECKA